MCPSPYNPAILTCSTLISPSRQLDSPQTARMIASSSRLRLSLPPELPTVPLPSSSPSHETSAPNDEYFATWRGRRIRLPGPLSWPCDSLEIERVEAQHWLLRLLLGYPYLGPVTEILTAAGENGKARVLDVATGAGVWAMNVAEMFPWAEVIGVDNAPIQDL
jgi:hypothetical protein